MSVPTSIWRNPIHFIACGFGSGAVPWAPGTFGTLAAIPIYLLMSHLSPFTYGIILLIMLCVGIFLCGKTAKDFGVHDHRSIVWDEIVGLLLTLWLVPFSITALLLGFLAFRLFDIWKPFPIYQLDKQVSGGLGIMMDDILAAVYANILLQIILYLFPRLFII
jgi:phosphatidylglycerophosphatase A